EASRSRRSLVPSQFAHPERWLGKTQWWSTPLRANQKPHRYNASIFATPCSIPLHLRLGHTEAQGPAAPELRQQSLPADWAWSETKLQRTRPQPLRQSQL